MKKVLIALVVLLLIGVVAFGVRTFGSRDESDGVDSKDAAGIVVGDEEADAADIDPGRRPRAGTYTYVGSGTESVTALGGGEHRFPKRIPVVVELDPKDDCAWVSNVIFVKQHIEERRFCTDEDGLLDRGFTRRIEFFNQLQTATYACPDTARRMRTDAKPKDTWTWACTQGTKATSDYTATYVGPEALTVGDDTVETMHVRVTSRQSGDTVGKDSSDFYYLPTGLAVRFTGNLEVTTKSVVGETTFRERLDYTLTSLVPETDED